MDKNVNFIKFLIYTSEKHIVLKNKNVFSFNDTDDEKSKNNLITPQEEEDEREEEHIRKVFSYVTKTKNKLNLSKKVNKTYFTIISFLYLNLI